MNFIREIILWFNSLGVKSQVVLVFLMSIGFTTLFLFISVIRIRGTREIEESAKNRSRKVLEDLIMSIIFEESAETRTEKIESLKKVVNNIKNPFAAEVCRELLYDVGSQLDGESQSIIGQIYRETGLKEKVEKELKEGQWDKKANAIDEIGVARLREMVFDVLAYTDNENETVRNKAQLVVLNLGGLKGLEFLRNIKTQISEWQQIQLLDQLLKMQYAQFPQTQTWLNSENDSVVQLAIKVVTHFMQFQDATELIKLVSHKNEKIVKKSIQALTKLGIKDCVPVIKSNFQSYSPLVQREAIYALGELGAKEEELFLLDNLMSEDYEMVKTTSEALLKLGQKDMLFQIKDSFPDYQKKIIEYTLDERV